VWRRVIGTWQKYTARRKQCVAHAVEVVGERFRRKVKLKALSSWAAVAREAKEQQLLLTAAVVWRAERLKATAHRYWKLRTEAKHVQKALEEAAKSHFCRELARRHLRAWAATACGGIQEDNALRELPHRPNRGAGVTQAPHSGRRKGPKAPGRQRSCPRNEDGRPVRAPEALVDDPVAGLRCFHLMRTVFRAWALLQRRLRLRPEGARRARPVRLTAQTRYGALELRCGRKGTLRTRLRKPLTPTRGPRRRSGEEVERSRRLGPWSTG